MGVDLASYRLRIGCYRHNHGTDVTRVTVTINVTHTAKIACLMVPVVFCILNALFCIFCSIQETEVTNLENIKQCTCVLYAYWYLCNRKSQCIESLVGAVSFIQMLLLAAGIEANPGPKLTSITKKSDLPIFPVFDQMTRSSVPEAEHFLTLQLIVAVLVFTYPINVFFSGVNSLASNANRGTQQYTYDTLRISFHDTACNEVKSSKTCSYLLGNKGVHMTNGNPHDKDAILLSTETTHLIERGVQDSIGYISLDRRAGDDILPNDDFFDHGTGFRVGDRYFMSAYHVFRKKINQLLDMIIICTPKCTPDLLKRLDIDDNHTEMEKETAIRRFIKKNGLDIPLLLSRLGSKVTEKVSEFKTGEWKENCVVDFVHHGRFTVDWNIPFGLAERDVVILQLLKTENTQHMPKPLFLEEQCEELDNVHLVRYITEGTPRIELDPMCKIYQNDEELAREIEAAIQWWTRIFPHKVDEIRASYSECSKAQNKDTGLVILKAAASFVEGSSGSPLVYLKSGQPFSGMVYQRGFPIFYYNKKEELKDKIQQSINRDIDIKVLFEGCTSMEKVSELLTSYDKQDLKQNIFNKMALTSHILKDKVRDDIRQSDTYNDLFTKASASDFQKFGLPQLFEMNLKKQPTEYMKRIVKQWKQEDEYFVDTSATRYIMRTITKSNIVIIVGASGSGKSFSMRHSALELQRHGYSVFVISDCFEIKDFIGSSTDRTIFLFDDPIGEDEIDQHKLKELKHHGDHIKANCKGSTKLVMTMRTELMNAIIVKDSGLISKSEIIDLHSTKLKLTHEEQKAYFNEAIYKRKLRLEFDDPIPEMAHKCDLNNFVLLVHMYCTDEYFRKHPVELFKEPLAAFESRLQRMWETNSQQFGGLVLCAVNHGKLQSELLDPFNCEFEQEQRNVKELLDKLSINVNMPLVAKELDKLQGIYIIKDKMNYEFKHNAFRNIVSFVVATRHNSFIINYCSVEFCLERCCLSRKIIDIKGMSPDKITNDKYKIVVNKSIEEPVAKKFVQSLEKNKDLVAKLFANNFCRDVLFLRRIFQEIQVSVKDGHFRKTLFYEVFCNACLIQADDIVEKLMHEFHEANHISDTGLTPLSACSFAGNIDHIKFILSKNCDVNISGTGWFNTTPLCASIKSGSLDIVKLLMSHGSNINQYDHIGRTPLAWSIFYEQIEIMHFLLANNADVEICGDGIEADTPLIAAVKKDRLDLVKLLLKHNARVNKLDGIGNTPLTWSIVYNHIDVLKLLLDNKADVNLCGNGLKAQTPLTAASCQSENIGSTLIACLLIMHHADVNKYDGSGLTPLALSILYNQAMVKPLIGANADVNLCGDNETSMTPLTVACMSNNNHMINLLLKANADVNKIDGMNITPVTVAVAGNRIDVVKLLIEHKADVNLCGVGDQAYTPLTTACQEGLIDIVRLLLKFEADVNQVDGIGRTPLSEAVNGNHVNIVKLLLDNKADVNLCSSGDEAHTPLTIACAEGFVEIVHLLLKYNVDVDKLSGNGVPPLTFAACGNHIYVVRVLLDNKADVNCCGIGDFSTTPLIMACLRGFVDIVQLLMKFHADVNKLDENNITPLVGAVSGNHIGVIRLLLDNKADVNLSGIGDQAYTPLTLACEDGLEEVIQLLLKHNVIVNKSNGFGRTPLTEAAYSNHTDVLQLLIDNKANVNLCGVGDQAYTPLTAACQKGLTDIVHLLLKFEADTNQVNGIGRTPLSEAVMGNHVNIVKLLLENKADVNLCGSGDNADTPLTIACAGGFAEIVHLLLKYNVDVDKLSGNGVPPLTIAACGNHIYVVRVLLDNKADVNCCGIGDYSTTPLAMACLRGFIDIVQLLMKFHADVNKLEENNITPLIGAISGNHIGVIRLLLDNKADVNLCGIGDQAYTPLTAACQEGLEEVIQLLLKNNAIVNKLNGFGRTPLTEAVVGNHTDVLQLLIDGKADVNLCGAGDHAYTPLTIACQERLIDIVRLLLKFEADVNQVDGIGRTPLLVAVNGNHVNIVKLLLENKADVNLCGSDKQVHTPLTVACRKGFVEIVHLLLKYNVDVDKLNGSGVPPLTFAACGNHIYVVRVLLDNKADVNCGGIGDFSTTPLIMACQRGFIDIVQLLLKFHADVNKLGGDNITPLIGAVSGNHIGVIRLLLDNKADVNLCGIGDQPCTPLTGACQEGLEEVIQLLLKHNVIVNKLNGFGRTPLTEAVAGNHKDLLKLLIDNKADVNLCGLGDQAFTPLTIACQEGLIDIVRLLLKFEADVNQVNGIGRTPLLEAVNGNHVNIVKLLLENKADGNLCGSYDKADTPLTVACQKGFEKTINLLLRYDVDVNGFNGNGTTPLVWAVYYNYIKIIRLLLDNKADVNLCGVGVKAVTPLTTACQKGFEEIVKLLLKYNVDVNKVNGIGRTPLTEAVWFKHIGVVQLLLYNNADINLCGEGTDAITPLTTACIRGFEEVVHFLLMSNADVNKSDGMGRTPLSGAIYERNITIVQILLDNKVNLNLTHFGITPLTSAVFLNCIHVVKLLLDNNADANLCDVDDIAFTPLTAACMIDSGEIVRVLLKHGAGINKWDGLGRTPLVCSVDKNHINIVKLLLRHDALIDYCGKGKWAFKPILVAFRNCNISIIRTLLNQ